MARRLSVAGTPLEPIAGRIERLVLAPAQIRDTVGWLARPLLRAFGWSPALVADRARALIAAMSRQADRRALLAEAIEELESNVAQVERACVVHGRPPMGHATWLFRLFELLARAREAIEGGATEKRRALACSDRALLLAPPDERGGGALVRVDVLLELARLEPEMLGRRRALLESARRTLLEAAAALSVSREHVGPRVAYIASGIEEIDRLQAAGVDPRRGLLHQARAAIARGERDRLRACVVALDAVARRRGDERLATLTARALDASGGDPLRRDEARSRASTLRSAEELFGIPLLASVREGLSRGQASAAAEAEKNPRAAARLLARGAERADLELISSMLAVDGLFDVGGTATPVRVVEEERRRVLVRHPTAQLVLVPAQRVEDLRDAVVSDPRALLFQLAEGTLLARRFADEEVRRRTRSRLSTELRIYVADGSSSMIGPRGRMRDAILIAELATLMERLRQPDRFLSPVLEIRFFDKELGAPVRVTTIDEAMAAIVDVLATLHTGGTDIQAALLGAFECVRERAATDPRLAEAQIVLVTDGIAEVDAEAVREARAAAGHLPIRTSIIALGVENRTLAALAAEQRARGERVFYHFVDDATLARICEGDTDRRLIVHAASDEDRTSAVVALIDEMETLSRERHRDERSRKRAIGALDVERARELEEAAKEVGLELEALFAEGEAARIASLERDERALSARFDRWFPADPRSSAPDPLPGSPACDEVDLARILIAATTEIVSEVGDRPAARRAEAIAIMERLAFEHGMPPWSYATTLREHGALLAEDLRALRAAVTGLT